MYRTLFGCITGIVRPRWLSAIIKVIDSVILNGDAAIERWSTAGSSLLHSSSLTMIVAWLGFVWPKPPVLIDKCKRTACFSSQCLVELHVDQRGGYISVSSPLEKAP
jgi:hypothetical protein